MNNSRIHRNKGFTLVELLLFMAMFSAILLVLTNLFSAIVEKQIEVESVSAVESDSKYILTRLLYDISRADTITTPAALGSQNSSLTLVSNGITYTYGLSGGNLRLSEGTENNTLNSAGTTISDLNFTRLGNINGKNAIQVSFTVLSTTTGPAGNETKSINTLIGLR